MLACSKTLKAESVKIVGQTLGIDRFFPWKSRYGSFPCGDRTRLPILRGTVPLLSPVGASGISKLHFLDLR